MKLKQVLPLVATVATALACALPGASPGADQLAQTMVVQTQEAAANLATETPVPPMATSLPPPTVTSTSPPTPTPAPTLPSHPIQLQDAFNQDSGLWTDCGVCTTKSGALHMGPFPISAAAQQQFALCAGCGSPTNFRMAADVSYGGGQTDRGFGFLMKGTDDYFITIEISPWQTIEAWKWDDVDRTWVYINGAWTGAVRTGSQPNHLEVEVTEAGPNASNVAIKVNGKTPLVLYNQPADPGFVGFTLYGHAVEVIFDNFEFEEYEPYNDASGMPYESGIGGS